MVAGLQQPAAAAASIAGPSTAGPSTAGAVHRRGRPPPGPFTGAPGAVQVITDICA
jgi:hypothetical protein